VVSGEVSIPVSKVAVSEIRPDCTESAMFLMIKSNEKLPLSG
jgi:hypothetical protein